MSEPDFNNDDPGQETPRTTGFRRFFEMAAERLWLALAALVALVVLVVSIILGDYARLIEKKSVAADIARSLKENRPVADIFDGQKAPFYLDPSFWSEILRELSFAVLIAVLISVIIEQQSHKRMEARVDAYNRGIAKNTLFATLGMFAARPVWAEIRSLIASMIIVRRELHATYELVPLTHVKSIPAALKARLGTTHIALKWTSSFTLANYSESIASYDMVHTFPLREELDNDRDASFLESIRIGEETLDAEAIRAVVEKLPMDGEEATFKKTISIPGRGSVPVQSVTYLLKEIDDSEHWATMLATQKLTLTLINSTAEDMVMGVQSFFPGELREETQSLAGRVQQWTATRPLLPFQGVTIWWRRNERPPAGPKILPTPPNG